MLKRESNMANLQIRAIALLALLSVVGCKTEPVSTGHSTPATAPIATSATPRGDLYYIDRCPVSGKLLGTEGDPVVRVYDGRLVRFGSDANAAQFERDLPASFAKLDATLIADQRPHYPLTTCLVTNKPLDSSAVEFILFNRLFRVGDRDAEARVRANPDEWFEKLDEAVLAKQAPGYVIHKCPVQGTNLAGKSPSLHRDVVVANRLIRTCCTDCAAIIRDTPSHYVPLIDSSLRMLHGEK